VDNGEVIALDIAYSFYANSQAFFKEAFVSAITAVMGAIVYSVYVTNFQVSSSGGTLIYFDTIIEGNDYQVAAQFALVQSLFCDPSGATKLGSPACAPLLAALNANGLPCTGAYYNDQLVASTFTASNSPPSPITTGIVGTFQTIDSGEVLAIDIPYSTYANNQQFYKEALTAALADTLSLGANQIWITDFQQSTAGTTKIYFDTDLFSVTSSSSQAVPTNLLAVQSWFSNSCNTTSVCPCDSGAAPYQGCPATNPALLASLQQYGLPVTSVYYNDQFP